MSRAPSSRLWTTCLAGLTAISSAPALSAETGAPTEDARKYDLIHQSTLLGDIFGIRSALAADGVTLFAGHAGETAWNIDGGKRRGIAYASQFDVGADVDLDRLAGWKGGTFHALIISRQGTDLSATRIGNLFAVQEIYGGEANVRLLFLAYEQSFAGDRLNIEAGRVAESSDFANASYFCHFQTGAICGVSYGLSRNGSFTFWPISSWGGRARVKLGNDFQVQVGAYEINPRLLGLDGFNLSARGATGVSIPVELAWRQPRTVVKIGYIYDTSRVPDIGNDPSGQPANTGSVAPIFHRGRSTGYAMADYVIKGGTTDGSRNVRVFGGIMVANRDRSYFENFEYAGVLKTGTFSTRPLDSVSFFIARGGISGDLATVPSDTIATRNRLAAETVLEVDYGIQATPWLNIMPNVQYIHRPRGSATIDDATVLGVKTNVTF